MTDTPALRHTLLNIGWSVAAVLVPTILTLWITPQVVRGLGTERYGIVILAMTTIGFLALLELGVSAAAVRDMARARTTADPEEGRRIFATVLSFYTCVGGVAALSLHLVGPWLIGSVFKVPPGLESEARSALSLAAIGLFINLVSPPFNGYLRAAERFDITSRVSIVTGAIGSFGAWYFARHMDLLGVLQAQVGTSALGWAAMVWSARRIDPARIAFARPSWQVLQNMGSYASWAFASQIFYAISQYSGRLIIAAALGTSNLAYFSIPLTLVQRVQQVTGAASQFLFPRVVSLGNDDSAVATLYRRSWKITVAVGLSICLPLAAAGGPLLRAWLGVTFEEASSSSLVILAVFFGFALMQHAVNGTLLGVGDARAHALLEGGHSILHLGLAVPLGKLLGLPGVALAFGISYCVVAVGHWVIQRKLGPEANSGLARGLLMLPAAALPGTLLAWLIAPWLVRFGVLGPLTAVGLGALATWAFILARPDWFLGQEGALLSDLVARTQAKLGWQRRPAP